MSLTSCEILRRVAHFQSIHRGVFPKLSPSTRESITKPEVKCERVELMVDHDSFVHLVGTFGYSIVQDELAGVRYFDWQTHVRVFEVVGH